MRAGMKPAVPIEPSAEKQTSVKFQANTTDMTDHKMYGIATDKENIDSAASDAGESDIDDVPEALLVDDDDDIVAKNRMSRIRNIDLGKFFRSSQYQLLSLIFGPMACFFFVA
jgi:hypothetical protein